MLRIIHITPHMGGGVGKVISRLSTAGDARAAQAVVLLEEPICTQFVQIAREGGVEVTIRPGKARMASLLADCDIAVVHWWHHPKTARLLCEFPKTAARVVIWTHISNLTVPALAPGLLLEATRVLFTAEASCEAPCFENIDGALLERRTGTVPGFGGLEEFETIKRKRHEGFNIGYLGFVDFSKLHPDFMSFCSAVNIEDARFILAGDAPARELLDRQAKTSGVGGPFIYPGYVTDVPAMLSEFDVFGYPLNPCHTCTTENSILEAMAAEVPPVLLNQLVEKRIVEDGKTGVLVSSAEEYGAAMRYLRENREERERIGRNARAHVLKSYKFDVILDDFHSNCELAMKEPKRVMDFRSRVGDSPAEWFVSCLGKDGQAFRASSAAGVHGQTEEIKASLLQTSPLLRGRNKGSLFHYLKEFPWDPLLRLWADMLKNGRGSE